MTVPRLIFDAARQNGMPVDLANFIVAQARHETNDFTSNVFKSCNNAFGYKYVGQRTAAGECTRAPEGGHYARYNKVEDSVNELVGWIRRRQADKIFPSSLATIDTAEKYSQVLKLAGYYGDPVTVYTNGLKKFKVSYGVPIAFGAVAILLTALLLYRQSKRK